MVSGEMGRGQNEKTGHEGRFFWDLVGETGFEPATFSSRTRRATKLRYTPNSPNSTQKLLQHKGLAKIFNRGAALGVRPQNSGALTAP